MYIYVYHSKHVILISAVKTAKDMVYIILLSLKKYADEIFLTLFLLIFKKI